MAGPYDIGEARRKFFDSRRADIDRNVRGQVQESDDVIGRRMAALGQTGSGAGIAAGQKAREAIEAQGSQARNELAGQEIQAMEPEAARQFASTQAEKDMGFKRQLFDIENKNKMRELDELDRRFKLDQDTTDFNKRMAEIEANRQAPGMLDGLLPGGWPKSPVSVPKRMFDPIGVTDGGGVIGAISGGGKFW